VLLLTAFEEFDGSGRNASLVALRAFLERNPARPVASAVLPVRYDADTAAVELMLRTHPIRTILHLGQARRPAPSLERVAVNFRTDADRLVPILADAPPAYRATIPFDEVLDAIRAAGLPAEDSAHAGTFLCNHVMYRSLHREALAGTGRRVGFLHLPRLPEQITGSATPEVGMPLEQTVRAVEAAVLALLR